MHLFLDPMQNKRLEQLNMALATALVVSDVDVAVCVRMSALLHAPYVIIIIFNNNNNGRNDRFFYVAGYLTGKVHIYGL